MRETTSARSAGAGRERRTQVDRSAATRAALADATVDLLVDKGWAAVTAIEVCTRVGVTRGAFHHHYESLPSLLADALRRLYSEMLSRRRPAPRDVIGLVNTTWAAIGNPRFKAVIEAWLAMANDPSLRGEIGPVVSEFATLVKPDAITSILTNAERRDFYISAREAMLGLALGRATNGGRPLGHERRVIARLRAEATALDSSHR
ncbi:MAG TPA: TetR/AcrR family transcriptional regulator [Acidimicrobiia bacterium]|jgi:AcrR family transcriptional regulator